MRGFAAAVAFSPDGRLLAVGGEGGRVTLWDARTLAPAGELTGLSGTRSGGYLLTRREIARGRGGRGRATSPPRLERRPSCGDRSSGHDAHHVALLQPGRPLIALAAVDGGTEIRDARSGRLVKRLPSEGLSRSVAFSPDGSLLAVGAVRRRRTALFHPDSWAPFGRQLEAHTQRITNVEFSRDGGMLATSSADGTVLLWDVETQEPIGSPLAVEPDTFVSAALSPDGSHLFAVSTAVSRPSPRHRPRGLEAPGVPRRRTGADSARVEGRAPGAAIPDPLQRRLTRGQALLRRRTPPACWAHAGRGGAR